jgi:hypothetical protein
VIGELGRRYWLGLPLPTYVLVIVGVLVIIAGLLLHWDFVTGAGAGMLLIGAIQVLGKMARKKRPL